jgi:hypothetical protein
MKILSNAKDARRKNCRKREVKKRDKKEHNRTKKRGNVPSV